MQLSTDNFAYKNRVFSAEASTLGGLFKNMFSYVHGGLGGDPSLLDKGESLLDEGFELVSARTGAVVKMVVAEVHRDPENEVTHWVFKPRQHDSFDSLVVFND